MVARRPGDVRASRGCPPEKRNSPSWVPDDRDGDDARRLPAQLDRVGIAPLPAASKRASTGAPSARTRATKGRRRYIHRRGAERRQEALVWPACRWRSPGRRRSAPIARRRCPTTPAPRGPAASRRAARQRVEHAVASPGDRQRGGPVPREPLGFLATTEAPPARRSAARDKPRISSPAASSVTPAPTIVDHAATRCRAAPAAACETPPPWRRSAPWRSNRFTPIARTRTRTGRGRRAARASRPRGAPRAAESNRSHGLMSFLRMRKCLRLPAAPDALLSRPWIVRCTGTESVFLTSSILMSSSYQEASWPSHSTYS